MKLLKNILLCFICIPLLTGCWDQNLLKDVRLIMAAGFDLTSDEKILDTITAPIFSATPSGVEIEKSQVISTIGNTTRDARINLDKKVSKRFDSSKLMIMLLGERYVKKDIYPVFDSFYRNPRSSLQASVSVVDGTANDFLQTKLPEKKTISEFLTEFLRSAQSTTQIPIQTTPLISSLYDPGMDLVLPLLYKKENEIQLKGLALFNENQYTGSYLTPDESLLYLLMSNQKGKRAEINLKMHKDKKPKMINYITINITKTKPDLIIKADDPKNMSVKLNLRLEAEVTEYPEDNLDSPKKIKELNAKLSEVLTKKANKFLKKIQKANSDILYIGRRINSFHHNTWEKINWNKEYPNLNMHANVNVNIVTHGVFN